MQLLRRFLVIQSLMLWQGGFLFYAAVVVPAGTDVLGSFQQGRVTRHVTDTMNVIGAISLAILFWDQIRSCHLNGLGGRRWLCWSVLLSTQISLFALHPVVAMYVDFSFNGQIWDYPSFYFWHRVYLYVSLTQWLFSLAYLVITLRAWNATPRAA